MYTAPCLILFPCAQEEAYEEIVKSPVQHVSGVAGDIDTILIVERRTLEALRKLDFVEGIQDTKSYVSIQPIK